MTAIVGLLLALLVVGAVMLWLPGRTSEHVRVGLDEVARAPERVGFEVGPLTWDVAAYERDARLGPLRRFLAEHCAGLDGLDAATCLSATFAATFAHGTPRREFVDAEYDPVTDLASHVAGAPGHCVTRTGLIAAILLSAGMAARQVQMAAPHHNVFEVFDKRWGWVLVDPTFGAIFRTTAGPGSAAALARGDDGQWTQEIPSPSPHLQLEFEPNTGPREIHFSDPWLYTRSGKRAAHWPFRGLFVDAGARSWHGGLRQQVARWTAGALILALVATFTSAGLRSRRSMLVEQSGNASGAGAPAGIATDG